MENLLRLSSLSPVLSQPFAGVLSLLVFLQNMAFNNDLWTFHWVCSQNLKRNPVLADTCDSRDWELKRLLQDRAANQDDSLGTESLASLAKYATESNSWNCVVTLHINSSSGIYGKWVSEPSLALCWQANWNNWCLFCSISQQKKKKVRLELKGGKISSWSVSCLESRLFEGFKSQIEMKYPTNYYSYWEMEGEKGREEGKGNTSREGDAVWKKCLLQFGI